MTLWMMTTIGLAVGVAAPERATEAFRAEHVEVKKHLDHVAEWAGDLGGQRAEDQRATMNKIVGFLREHLVPHAQWEDRVLYPLVDEKAGTTDNNRFTAVMRFEHQVVGRWIDELAAEARKPTPDVRAFARRTDNLLGLVRAHFEAEEQVLLPVLDKTMTKAEFERRTQSR